MVTMLSKVSVLLPSSRTTWGGGQLPPPAPGIFLLWIFRQKSKIRGKNTWFSGRFIPYFLLSKTLAIRVLHEYSGWYVVIEELFRRGKICARVPPPPPPPHSEIFRSGPLVKYSGQKSQPSPTPPPPPPRSWSRTPMDTLTVKYW